MENNQNSIGLFIADDTFGQDITRGSSASRTGPALQRILFIIFIIHERDFINHNNRIHFTSSGIFQKLPLRRT